MATAGPLYIQKLSDQSDLCGALIPQRHAVPFGRGGLAQPFKQSQHLSGSILALFRLFSGQNRVRKQFGSILALLNELCPTTILLLSVLLPPLTLTRTYGKSGRLSLF